MGLFHESLSGPAFQWFMDLEVEKKEDWKEFTRLFINQYGFNLDTAPTREQLSHLKKKGTESFKQYAQRWMTEAVQVRPPLTNAEMCNYFLGTLESPFVGAMAGGSYATFSAVIDAGERIELLVKSGKISSSSESSTGSTGTKKNFSKKKESDVHMIYTRPSSFLPRNPPAYPPYQALSPYQQPFSYPPPPYHSHQIHNTAVPPSYPNYRGRPRPIYPNAQNPPLGAPYQRPRGPAYNQGNRPPRPQTEHRPFPNFNLPKNQLLDLLMSHNLLSLNPLPPLNPPYPSWYDPNAMCVYHMGAKGHSLENCEGFKRAVLRLLDRNVISLDFQNAPNVQHNPLPNHGGGPQINAIECIEESVGTNYPLKLIYEGLVKAGHEQGREADKERCLHCNTSSHYLEDCEEFKSRVIQLIALGIIRQEKKNHSEMVMVEGTKFPLKIPARSEPILKFTVPAPFPYESSHAVPWQYETKIEAKAPIGLPIPLTAPNIEEIPIKKSVQKVEASVDVEGITRAGRCYTSEEIERQREQRLKGKGIPTGQEKEANEDGEDGFLKIMKQSEFSITEQLKKTPARISLYSLIMSSEVHRKALQDMLDKAFVPPGLTTENLVNMLDPVQHISSITFMETEITPASTRNPRALHITLKCYGHVIARVLIDGGSALNVLPYNTLKQLPVDSAELKNTTMTVKAFDGTASKTIGRITLPLIIGPSLFETELEVMDIMPSYTILLGRPWIHEAGVVPSTLHQRVKFIHEDAVITVRGEDDILIMKPSSVPYIEGPDKVDDNGHHSFEIVEETIANIKKGGQLSIGWRIMEKYGYVKGQGLGARSQGIAEPIIVKVNQDQTGLGYEESLEQQMGRALVLGKARKKGLMSIPPLYRSFLPASGVEDAKERLEDVDTIEEEQPELQFLFPVATGDLTNWESKPLPDVSIM